MAHRFLILSTILLLISGCVRRTLTVTSDPPGALVYLNDQEFGRTPITRDFTWYGTYDVRVRSEGHETLKTEAPVIAPWWQWVPLDLVAELFPLTDRRQLHFKLQPTSETAADPQQMLNRAETMRAMLRSSRHTRQPATQPQTP